MEASIGQAREASIILSNILSRKTEISFDPNQRTSQSLIERPSSRKRNFNLWHQDKETLLSHDINTEGSVKI